MAKLDEQISTLEDKLKQLKLKQQRSQARQRAVEASRERKAETRRKVLVGTVVMAKARDGEMDAAAFCPFSALAPGASCAPNTKRDAAFRV